MQDIAFYAGVLAGAFLISVLVECVILLAGRLRKREARSGPQPVLSRERLIRMLFVTAIFFVLSVFGK